jgi:hypothetical protein
MRLLFAIALAVGIFICLPAPAAEPPRNVVSEKRRRLADLVGMNLADLRTAVGRRSRWGARPSRPSTRRIHPPRAALHTRIPKPARKRAAAGRP